MKWRYHRWENKTKHRVLSRKAVWQISWNKPVSNAATTSTNRRLRKALSVAMETLVQIANTPKNQGARHKAFAAVAFLKMQMPNLK